MIGHAFRSLLAFLDERDLREAVLARVPPEVAYHVVEGTLRFVLELCDRPGEVDRFELVSATPSGSVVRFAVRWQ